MHDVGVDYIVHLGENRTAAMCTLPRAREQKGRGLPGPTLHCFAQVTPTWSQNTKAIAKHACTTPFAAWV